MRDVHERDADLVLDPLQLELHLLAQLEVERPERLVEEEHPRPVDECARERDPLLLAAGELPRLAPLEPREPDELERLDNAAAELVATYLLPAQSEGDVLEDRQVREERVRLEHRVHVALVRRQSAHVAAAELDAAGGRVLEAADHPEGGRLAAAGRTEHGEEAAAPDVERDLVDGGDVLESLRQVDEADVDVGLGRRCGRHRTCPHAASRTSPRMPAISSNSCCAAISGGEIWIDGVAAVVGAADQPLLEERGERKPRSSVSHSSS